MQANHRTRPIFLMEEIPDITSYGCRDCEQELGSEQKKSLEFDIKLCPHPPPGKCIPSTADEPMRFNINMHSDPPDELDKVRPAL